jgi:hypothetical protein
MTLPCPVQQKCDLRLEDMDRTIEWRNLLRRICHETQAIRAWMAGNVLRSPEIA